MARGRLPVERFQEGAEKYGYIVVGSNNSRNGPWPPNAEAVKALWHDTHARFSIDGGRVYTTGFSGGARVASWLALTVRAAGVVACGGGFPDSKTPQAVPFAFFGAAGIDDFNYHEMRQIGRDLDARSAVHRIAIFNGEHTWAPVALAREALEWFELQAMRGPASQG
jgi:dienelactone hydrolase